MSALSYSPGVIARRLLGFALFASGGLLLSFAGARYATGWYRAEQAREAWNAAEASAAVRFARSFATRTSDMGAIALGAPVARLVIPRLALDDIVLEGVGSEELNAGPGHLPGSALPGARGNAVISAHRDRHFSHLDKLQVGDTVWTEAGEHRNAWIVISARVVDNDDPAIFAADEPTLTLTTCWPVRYLGPAPSRLIVTARPMTAASTARITSLVLSQS